MTHQLKSDNLLSDAAKTEEEYSIPLNISDIIIICKEYNKLGYNIQHQVETIIELGVTEAIATKTIKQEALPHIQNFLKTITANAYFGDATEEAYYCINLIKDYIDLHQGHLSTSN